MTGNSSISPHADTMALPGACLAPAAGSQFNSEETHFLSDLALLCFLAPLLPLIAEESIEP